MKWVYILKCEDDYYYVGETERLYRRFWEHYSGRGGVNTSIYKPEYIVAIYKVNTLGKFIQYNNNVIDTLLNNYTVHNQNGYNKWLLTKFNDDIDYEYYNLEAENNITECLMINNKDNWEKIIGGKYTRFNCEYKFPVNNYIKELPICKCGFPCDIKKNEDKNYLFFRCAKKNIWDNLKEQFDIDEEPCNFYMEYSKDKQFRLEESKKFEDRRKTLKELFKKSFWLNNIPIYDIDEPEICVGDCNNGYHYSKISYYYEERNLCYDCFIDKNEELSKKFGNKIEEKCLLKIK
jgi:hypothetical protein